MCLLSSFSVFCGRVPTASSIAVCWVQGCRAQREQGKSGTNSILCGLFWWSLLTEFKVEGSLTCEFQAWSLTALNHCWEAVAQPHTTFLSSYCFQEGPCDQCLTMKSKQKLCGSLLNQVDVLSAHFLFPLPGYKGLKPCVIGVSKDCRNIIS